jgi:hypothetical protein
VRQTGEAGASTQHFGTDALCYSPLALK